MDHNAVSSTASAIFFHISAFADFQEVELPRAAMERFRAAGGSTVVQWLSCEPRVAARVCYEESHGVSSLTFEFPLTSPLGEGDVQDRAVDLLRLARQVASMWSFGLSPANRLTILHSVEFATDAGADAIVARTASLMAHGVHAARALRATLAEQFGFDTAVDQDKIIRYLLGHAVTLSPAEAVAAVGGWEPIASFAAEEGQGPTDTPEADGTVLRRADVGAKGLKGHARAAGLRMASLDGDAKALRMASLDEDAAKVGLRMASLDEDAAKVGLRMAALDDAAKAGLRMASLEDVAKSSLRMASLGEDAVRAGLRMAAVEDAVKASLRMAALEDAAKVGLRMASLEDAAKAGLRMASLGEDAAKAGLRMAAVDVAVQELETLKKKDS